MQFIIATHIHTYHYNNLLKSKMAALKARILDRIIVMVWVKAELFL